LRLEVPNIAIFVGKWKDPIGVKEYIEQKEKKFEAEAKGLCEGPIRRWSDGRRWGWLFHVWGLV